MDFAKYDHVRKNIGIAKSLGAVALVLVIVLGVYALWRSLQPKWGGEMVRFAPSSSFAVGFVDLREQLDPKLLRDFLDEPKVGRQIRGLLGIDESDLTTFESWFVPALMVAAFPENETAEPSAVMAIPVNDEAPLLRLMEKLFREQDWVEVAGARCGRVEDGGLVTIYQGHLLASSGTKAMELALEAWAGENVWESPQFQAAVGKLHDETPLGSLYLRFPEANGEVQWFIASAELQNKVLSSEGFLKIVPGSRLAQVLLQDTTMNGGTLGLIPKSATSATVVNFAYLRDAFAAAHKEELDELLGPTVRERIEAFSQDLDGEVAWTTDLLDILPGLGLAALKGGDGSEVSGLAVVRAADSRAAKELFESMAAKLGAVDETTAEGRSCLRSDWVILCPVTSPVNAVLIGVGPRAQIMLEQSLKAGASGESLLVHPKVSKLIEDSRAEKLVMLDHADFHKPVAAIAGTYGALASLVLDLPFNISEVVKNPYFTQALKSASYVQAESGGMRYRGYGAGNPVSMAALLMVYWSLMTGI